MRAVEGTKVAVLVRELLSDDRAGMRKVSLRATDGSVDVSRIAREFGGGGHPQAAGFSTAVPYPELVDQLRGARARPAPGLLGRSWTACCCCAKPAGVTSHDVVAEVRRSLPRGTKVATPGRSTRSRRACCSCSSGRATRAQRFLMALPKTYRAVARLGWTSDTGDRDGELVADGAHAGRARRSRRASSCRRRRPTRR